VTRRSRIVGFGSAALLVLAGIACAVVLSGALAQNLEFVLVALGLVLATSLVFYEVGLSEDRDRASRARRREADSEAQAERDAHPEREAHAERERARKPPHHAEPPTRVRLGRNRGRPRRLR
jgi:hypothetical protein